VADEITDSYEKLAYTIYFPSDSCKTSANKKSNIELIEAGKNIDPHLMNMKNSINSLLRSYRKIEELVELYGIDWIRKRLAGEISEYDSLNNYLKQYYIKHLTNKNVSIDIIRYNKKYETEVEKIDGVKINEPVIKYN